MKRALIATFLVALTVLPIASWALSRPERAVVSMTNNRREYRGLRPMLVGWRLSEAAQRHAERMASAGRIFHGTLGFAEGRGCWGQNVGVGPTPWRVFDAFMRSGEHRANILGRCRYIGVGVVRRNGLAWVVMDFGDARK